MPRYHEIRNNVGLCQGCLRWCLNCNQCKCEIGLKRLCPGFDVKEFPIGYEHWKLDQEIERLEDKLLYIPAWSKDARRAVSRRLDELFDAKEGLASAG
jgi:hypothetical protein